ncbi:hypothetical protein Syun_020532 [Stephania yunnanensis]|uniref:Uncharacterized protein n=1 Tax=Stephania yunnanensis TaxID=152371 RepID=A0AAP0IED2_9MAGN
MSLPQPNQPNNGFIQNAPPLPNSGMRKQPSHSNSSYGPVFIVLAVVVGISLIACLLNRLCTRKFSSRKENQRARFDHPKERDVENGRRVRFAGGQADHNERHPEFKQDGNGEIKEEMIQPGGTSREPTLEA